jgi:uncharacterized protein (DUF1684 family)
MIRLAVACLLLALPLAAAGAPAESASPAKPEVAWLPAPYTAEEFDTLHRGYRQDRADTDTFLRTNPNSSLGAFARVDFKPGVEWLVIGSAPECALVLSDPSVRTQHVRVRLDGPGFRVEALDPGATFTAFGAGGRDTTAATLPPSFIGVGRYRVRLSYQNAPALIAFDPDLPAKAAFKGTEWWPVNLDYRYLVALQPDPGGDTLHIESTNGPPRASLRAGWFHFVAGGKKQRLAAIRLLEPGVGEHDLSVLFRDGTSGKGSYGMGRYVDPVRRPDGKWILDFNNAYNPTCWISPFYNCPVPPAENTLTVRVPVGQKYEDPAAPREEPGHEGHGHAGHRH